RNAFVSLGTLAGWTGTPGRVNALLGVGGDAAALQARLRAHLTLDDWGLVLHTPQSRTDSLFAKLDKNGDGKLQRAEWRGQLAGTLVAAAPSAPVPDGTISREDLERFYREHHNYLGLESRQMLLEPAVGDAALRAAQDVGLRAAPTLVYLANTIAAN